MAFDARARAAICTLGCRVNQYESEAIAEELQSFGFIIADFSEVCDVYIINTCAVTEESERKSRQMIRRAAGKNPNALILVTGCFSQLHPEGTAEIPGVVYVCGNRNKLSVAQSAADFMQKRDNGSRISVLDVEHTELEPMRLSRASRGRVYVKIEDGCDNHCTYCIIKRARGSVVSRPADEILSEIKTLAADGCREVILTGIEAASYGRDLDGFPLSRLMGMVAAENPSLRIRVGSLEPSVMTKAFCDTISAYPNIMPSFHLSLQSGSDTVLAAMKRKYNRRQVLENVAYMKKVMPGVTFSCDIIVGFPGEREKDFADTMEIAEAIGFLHMHIFPFSPREGTPAADMPRQLSEQVKHERLLRLDALGKSLSGRLYHGAISSIQQVLVESKEGGLWIGHAENMMEVAIRSETDLAGQVCPVQITDFDGKRLVATPQQQVKTV